MIAENIEYHWPHIATEANTRKPSGRLHAMLKSARNYFIASIIKQYVESGMTNSYEIVKQFRPPENPKGISRQRVLRTVIQEYQVSSWADFLTLCQAPLSPQSLKDLSPEEYKKVGGVSLEQYNNFLIDSYVIKGHTIAEIDALMSHGRGYTSRNLKNRYGGGIREARKQLVGPILALCLKLDYSAPEIHGRVPFFQRFYPGSSPDMPINHFCKQWFTINPTEAREILCYRSLNHFLAQYLNS